MIRFFIGVIVGGGIVSLCAMTKIAKLRIKICWLERDGEACKYYKRSDNED